jgi:hypothetical protein
VEKELEVGNRVNLISKDPAPFELENVGFASLSE